VYDFFYVTDVLKYAVLFRRNASEMLIFRALLLCQVPELELGHRVTGSMGHLGHLSRLGHRVTGSSL